MDTKKLRKRSDIIKDMYEGAVAATVEIEVAIIVKERMILGMIHTSEQDLRSKVEIQIAKEKSQLEQQKKVEKITMELFNDALKEEENEK